MSFNFVLDYSEEIKIKCYIKVIESEALGQRRHSFYVFVYSNRYNNAKPVRTAVVFSSPKKTDRSQSAKQSITADQ